MDRAAAGGDERDDWAATCVEEGRDARVDRHESLTDACGEEGREALVD